MKKIYFIASVLLIFLGLLIAFSNVVLPTQVYILFNVLSNVPLTIPLLLMMAIGFISGFFFAMFLTLRTEKNEDYGGGDVFNG